MVSWAGQAGQAAQGGSWASGWLGGLQVWALLCQSTPATGACCRRRDCLALVEACFPSADGSREASLLREHFSTYLCGAHSCDGKRRRALLRALAQASCGLGWAGGRRNCMLSGCH